MIIGIAGGTAGGKTTFCEKLTAALDGLRVNVIHLDSFYISWEERTPVPSHLNGRLYMDDNTPEALDWEKCREAFDKACAGGCDVLIVEGLFALWDEHIRSRLDMKIFVDCRSDERIVRRIRRNMAWGLSFDEITDVYLDMVRFRHDQYVEPTKWTADLIVNGSGNTDLICAMCADRIRNTVRK